MVGGGAGGALKISGEKAGFGIEDFEQGAEEEGGEPTTQAGAHPFQYTTTVQLNREPRSATVSVPYPVHPVKDLHFVLPPGFVGDPVPLARCGPMRPSARRRGASVRAARSLGCRSSPTTRKEH